MGKWVTERLRNLSKATQEIVSDWIRTKTQVPKPQLADPWHFKRAKPALPQRKAVLRLGKHSSLEAGTIFSRPGLQNTQLVATQVCAAAEGSGQRAGLPQAGLPRLPLARSTSRGKTRPRGGFWFSPHARNKSALLHRGEFLCHLEVFNQHLLIKFLILWGDFPPLVFEHTKSDIESAKS